MATSNILVAVEDGWQLAATDPGFLRISTQTGHKWSYAIADTTPAASEVGIHMPINASLVINEGFVGNVYVRVQSPAPDYPSGKVRFDVTALATTGGGGGGGAGDASAANQSTQITAANLTNARLGDVTTPAAGSVNARLVTLNTTLGSPFQAGGSIGNTSFAISGTLPAFASTPTVNSAQSGAYNITNISGTVSLPTGAATETTLAAQSAKLPATLGAKTGAASLSVVPNTDTAFPISAASLPLPTGAATAAGLTTINTTLGTPFQAGASIANTTFAATQATASSLNAAVVGNVASAATDSGNPVKVGGVYNSSPGTLTSGQRGDVQVNNKSMLQISTNSNAAAGADAVSNGNLVYLSDIGGGGRLLGTFTQCYNGSTWDRTRGDVNGQITQPWAPTGSRWTYAAASGGITNTTTAVTIAAAAGSTVRNYLTGLQINAGTLGAGTEIAIRDGAGGSVLWRGVVTTSGLNESFTFPSPLRGTANTLMEVVTLTATVTGAVYINAQGFTGT